uniref:Metalloendopeptidase n=1 Tax=Strongyloides papillosus TaxID=174720 RepID=A0A0N5BDK6_STREA
MIDKAICMYLYKDKHIINKRDIMSDKHTAWNNPIKYQIKDGLTDNVIEKALKEIENNTCIEFKASNLEKNDTQGIVFEKDSYCASSVGRVHRMNTQTIQLTIECGKSIGVILHELGHALGLVHEQSRTDRDKYVDVANDNIQENERVNFKIRSHEIFKNFSIYYDYASIMHYGQYDFATRRNTPVLKSNLHSEYDRMMGQRLYMTFNDYKQLNLAHCCKCNIKKTKEKKGKGKKGQKGQKEKKKNRNPCFNGGYLDFRDCKKCICPLGYTGSDCNNIAQSDKSCGDTTYKVTKNLYKYGLLGEKKCFVFLLAEEGKKIEITVYYAHARSRKICTEDVSHQIKYLLCLC